MTTPTYLGVVKKILVLLKEIGFTPPVTGTASLVTIRIFYKTVVMKISYKLLYNPNIPYLGFHLRWQWVHRRETEDFPPPVTGISSLWQLKTSYNTVVKVISVNNSGFVNPLSVLKSTVLHYYPLCFPYHPLCTTGSNYRHSLYPLQSTVSPCTHPLCATVSSCKSLYAPITHC